MRRVSAERAEIVDSALVLADDLFVRGALGFLSPDSPVGDRRSRGAEPFRLRTEWRARNAARAALERATWTDV
jgi:hypothetical protein